MIGHAGENVGEPGLRINVVHFCRDDQRVHDRGALTATVGSSKQPRLSAKSDPAQGAFCSIVGETDAAIFVAVDVWICRMETEATWTLEVVNSAGTCTVWDDLFPSDDAADEAFLRTVADEGMAAFVDSAKVVPFRR